MKKAKRTVYLEKHIDKLIKKWVNSGNPYKWEIIDSINEHEKDFKYFFELGYQKAKRDLNKEN